MKTPRPSEVLAVVGIVAFLAAVLFPVFAQTKGGPKRAGCLLNVKRMGIGAVQYASDCDDRFPLRDVWMDATYPYLKSEALLHCNAVPKGAYGYAFNAALSGARVPNGSNLVPLIYDSVDPIRNASDLVTSLPLPGRHWRGKAGGNYVAYEDSHIKWVAAGGRR